MQVNICNYKTYPRLVFAVVYVLHELLVVVTASTHALLAAGKQELKVI